MYVNIENESELGIWKYDYFQIPCWFDRDVQQTTAAQNALPSTCSSTVKMHYQALVLVLFRKQRDLNMQTHQVLPPSSPVPKAPCVGLQKHLQFCGSSRQPSHERDTRANPISKTHPSDSYRRTPHFRCLDVLLAPHFFTNCSCLRAEKFHSTGHKVSI